MLNGIFIFKVTLYHSWKKARQAEKRESEKRNWEEERERVAEEMRKGSPEKKTSEPKP